MKKFYILLFILVGLLSEKASGQINTPSPAHPFNSNTAYSFGIMPTNLPTSGTYTKSQDAADAYNTWKTNYVRACGSEYRVLFDDGSSTVSEGIGYGMLLAAYAGDKALVDGLWAYYKTNANGNGLMNWKIGGCTGASGTNGASDADEDAAMALIVAACQWPSATSPYNYNTEANTLITAIGNKEVVPGSNQINNGDGWGFSNTCRNPSYFAPGYYRMFAGQVSAQASLWNNAASASYTLLNANVNSSTGLVSNWSDNNGSPNTCNGPNEYGYDACRNPWRMAVDVLWYGTAAAQNNFCSKIAAYCQSQGATSVGGAIPQSGGTGSHNPTFISTFAAGICGATSSSQTIMNQMYSETVAKTDSPPLYFGNTLRCLSLFVMTGNFWKPCGSAAPGPVTVSITSPANNAVVNEGTNVTINATATTTSGSITKVDFYSNGTLIGTSTASPYSFTLANPIAGNYQLTAIATNSSSQTATSSIVNIQVLKVVYSTSTAPTIDGTIEASWSSYPATSITKVIIPTISSSTDLSATFQSRWDASALYILMNVTDDVKKNDSPASNVYDDDAVEIYIDINNDKATTYGANDFEYTFRWNDATLYEKNSRLTGVVLGQTTTATGYIMEIKIPWSTLTLSSPAAGVLVGFDVMINDDDDGGTRDGKMSWNAGTDNAWQDPSLFGTVILAGAPPVTCTAPGASITAGGATTFCAGGNVVLNANTGTGLTYQWKSGGTAIAGATASSYTATTSGSYTVDVSSGACTSTSGATTVTVNPMPAVPTVTAGGATTFCSGANVVLSTSATGVTFQWKSGGTAISGATASSYTATATGSYTVTVTASGCSSTSSATAVTVNSSPATPSITAGGATTFCSGGSVVLSTSATGVTYQWKNGGTAIAGATASSYTATSTGSYTVTVTASGCSSTSTATSVTVNATPAVPTITAGGATTFCTGGNVVLSTSATGVTFQWQNGGTAIAGATSSSYTATASGSYTVTVSVSGCSSTSAATVVTVNPSPATPSITAGGATTFCSGGNVVLSTGATGVTYQWKNGGTAIAGATTSSYTATATGSYTVTVTASGCSSTSTATSVTVNPTPTVPTVTAGGATTFCTGGNVVLSTSATGVTFQWQNGGANIAGATSSSYTAIATGSYTVTVTASGCSSTSAATAVTVNPSPATPSITAGGATTFCSGGNVVLSTNATGVTYQWKNGGTAIAGATTSSYTATATGSYTVTVTASGCSSTSAATSVTASAVPAVPTITAGGATTFCAGGNVVLSTGATGVTFQWQNGGTDIAGATSSSYTATASGSYTVTVSASGCSSTSAATAVTVNPSPATPTIIAGGATTFCSGGNVVLSTSAGGVTYQWKNGGTNIAGATASSYTATTTGSYTVTVTASGCSSTSTAMSVTVNPTPAVPTVTAGGATTFCSGGNVVLSTSATGVVFQWQNGGIDIAGATTSSYTATSTGSYTVTVSALGCSSISSATAVTVNPTPAIPGITSNGATTFCSGGNVVLSTGATGVTYQWKNGGTNIAGANASSYTAATTGSYTVTVTASGCSSTSTATSVTSSAVPATPTITAGGATTFCAGGNVVLSTGATGVTYQWQNGGTDIAGATASSYTATATGSYTVTVAASGCSSTSSATAVTVSPSPATPIITAGGATTFCSGGNVVLSTSATGVAYQWKNGGANIAGATTSSYTATATGSYTVTVTASGCSSTSTSTSVTANAVPAVPTITASGATTFCSGGNVALSTSATGVTFQWNNGGTAIAGATASSYTATNTGSYTITVTTSGCSSTSAATAVTANANPATPVISAGGPTTFCSGSNVVLSTTATGVTYQWNNGGLSIAGATTSSYTATAAGSYTVTVTSSGCTSTSAATTTTVNSSIAASVSIASNVTSICSGTSVNFSATPGAGVPSPSYQWKKNGSNIGGATSAAYSATGVLNGDAFICVMTSSGSCVTGSPATSNSISISVSSQPTAANAGPDQYVTTTSADLAGNTAVSGSGVWTLINGSGTFANSGSPSSTVSGLSSGVNTFRWTISSGSCNPSSDDVIINVGTAPATSSISGPAIAANNSTSVTYSVTNHPGSSYNWTVPPGAVITSGQGTNTITVDFGTTDGSVGVTETNPYGSTTVSKPVDLGAAPVSGGTIAGPANVADNSTSVTYSVPNNPGSTYNWTVPPGAVITSGQGTNSITVDFGTSGGSVGVTETNIYGSGTSTKSVNVGPVPSTSSITGPDTVGYNQTGVTYSVTSHPGSTYNWTVPPGATIISGQGTSSIVVDFGNSSGNVSVTESNSFGSTAAVLPVVAGPPPTIPSVTGPNAVSQGQTYTYSVPVDPTVSYNWSVPPGATIISGQGTNVVTVNYGTGATSGAVSVTETSPYGSATGTSSVAMSASGISSGYASDPSSVYPNPFNHDVTIRINSAGTTDLSLRVIDLKGTEVYSASGYYTNEDIKLGSELKPGLYIVRATYGSKMSLIKVTKVE
jgi:endo-1,4-beta-D-glucanase Y